MSNTVVNPPAKGEMVVLVPEADMQQILKLDQASKAANRQLIQAELDRNDMAKGLIMARAMKTLRDLLTPAIMSDVMELMNSPLGFRTDKDPSRPVKSKDGKWETPKPYTQEVVRDVMIQALLRGLRPTNNEINIIAAGLYVTKEGYERLLREFPGLAKLQIDIGVPLFQGEAGALVPCRASWEIDGRSDLIVCEKGTDADYRIPIRVNAAMGVDAIQGKAKSKLYRRIYERLTGTALASEAEGEDGDVIDGTAQRVDAGKSDVPTR
jgi:hypothetical protein